MSQRPSVTLDNLVGNYAIKRMLTQEVIRRSFLTVATHLLACNFDKHKVMCILMYGPPGTGKTFTIECCAPPVPSSVGCLPTDECCPVRGSAPNIEVYAPTPRNFAGSFYGDGEDVLHKLIDACKKHDFGLLFLDEMDAAFSARTGKDQSRRAMQLHVLSTGLWVSTAQVGAE